MYSAGKYLNGQKDGLWKYYNERGVLTAEGSFRLGLEDGQWFRYHNTGQLESVGSYVMGEEDGKWGQFYVNGQLVQDESWQMGLLRNVGPYHTIARRYFIARNLQGGYGERLTYYPTGELRLKASYENGLASGVWEYYYRDGGNIGRRCHEQWSTHRCLDVLL